MRFLSSSIISIVLFSFTGCGDSVSDFQLHEIDPRIIVEFELTNGLEVIDLNEEFTDDAGYRVRIVEARYLISDLQLESVNGSDIVLKEIELIDHREFDETITTPQWNKSYKFSVPPGEYTNLKFGLGVRSDLNTTDPTDLPNEDPLSLYGGMHWTWATMYKFVMFHAKIDTLGGSDLLHEVTFETGLDSLYRSGLSFPVNLSLESFDRDTIRLTVDWNTIFHGSDPIDLTIDNISHTFGSVEAAELAVRFTDNYVEAIELD
ncbi:MAG: hypothetical protein HN542_03995 [Flavobacteriales bacterium]|jgi:hypothetical protein|nr:hypothetical protein [Flavobacteriales bacterium]MBT3963051.1 hypothetical protein [Flavobacteriales bacterium]MBT4704118.1 hypothetical protein [Flavobacteriales bacterium]MBT4931787.1 hypothetical protein [Flavobacteriales bacterium]MBT5132974.1 hypothetical protein [Flavobacteriales bacterium]